MFDITRIRGEATTVLGFALAFGLLCVAASQMLGGRPVWMSDRDPTANIQNLRLAAERIVGVAADVARKPPGVGRLGLLIGASDILHDVDPARLDTGPDDRWAAVYAEGGNGTDHRVLADLVAAASLKPDRVVLFLIPSAWVKESRLQADDTAIDLAPIREHLAAKRLRDVKDDLGPIVRALGNRVLPNRSRVKQHIRLALFKLKLATLKIAGLTLAAAVPPDPKPWANTTPWGEELHGNPDQLRRQEEGFRSMGTFETANYGDDSSHLRDVVELLRDARRRGLRPVVVLSPLQSDYRQLIPAEAVRSLETALRREFAEPPEVIDARESVADDLFHDLTHLNHLGRMQFTGQLSARLRPLIEPK